MTTRAGLRWKKLDLHVHTPASADYTGPAISPDDFVATAIEKGVDAIAVTDHNTAEWVDRIKDAANGTSLAVFPGVEITATGGKSGIHIIALFDRDRTARDVDALLATVGIMPSAHGQQDALAPKSPQEVIAAIAAAGALPILAHADSSKGVLRDMSGTQRVQVVQHHALVAAEVTNVAGTGPFLQGGDPHYRRKLAYYRASDNPNPSGGHGHSADGIGTRYSWFKLDGITLDALRQCFTDPDIRILSDTACDAGHPDRDYPRIIRAEVTQGFLGGATFEFHEGLNSVIGGKGVGKSLIVEYLRFALDQPSPIASIKKDMDSKLEAQLGRGGIVRVTVQVEPGDTLVVERTYDGRTNPIAVRQGSTGRAIDVHLAQVVPILAYSQTETLEIAKDSGAQLRLIDSFIEHTAVDRQLAETRTALSRNAAEMAKALEADDLRARRARDLATATELVARLDRALESPHYDEVQRLKPRSSCLRQLTEHVSEVEEHLQAVGRELAACTVPTVPADLAGDQELTSLSATISQMLRDAQTDVAGAEARVRQSAGAVAAAVAAWKTIVDEKEAAYTAWVRDQGADRAALQVQRQHAEEDREAAARAVEQAEATAAALPGLRTERERLLDELGALTDTLYGSRAEKYAAITALSNDRLRLTLSRGAARGAYHTALAQMKRGSNVQESTVQSVVARVSPRRLVELVLADDATSLATEGEVLPKTAEKLVGHLRGQPVTELLALEHDRLVEDEPRIEYRKEDGSYHDLDQLSVGQKCTALLIVALVDGGRPVLIDQPEDALDIPSVYEDVTLPLRGRKHERQFIVTTHNPTVAVAGDSDKFHVLRASAKAATVSVAGAIDQRSVRTAVLQHLEGGHAPLQLKIEKYQLAGR